MHIRRHTITSPQVTAGQVLVDKKETPTIVSIDDVFHSLDSLAHLNIDTILTNPTGYIITLDSLINNLNPNNLNDTVIQTLDIISEQLYNLLNSNQLSENNFNEINNLLQAIENKNSYSSECEDNSIKFLIVVKNSKKYLKTDETYYAVREDKPLLINSFVNCIENLQDVIWNINGIKVDDKNIINSDKSTKLKFLPDKIGEYIISVTFSYKQIEKNEYKTETSYIKVIVTDKPIVLFDYVNFYSYDGTFGFEKYEFEELKDIFYNDELHQPIIINEKEYVPSLLSISSENSITIVAETLIPEVYEGLSINFESSNSSIIKITNNATIYSNSLQKGWNKINIEILAKGQTGYKQFEFINVKNEKDEIIGRINIQSIFYKMHDDYITDSFVLVKVKTKDDYFIDAELIKTNLENFLNKNSYNQVFIYWKFINIEEYDIRDKSFCFHSLMNISSYINTTYVCKNKNYHYIFLLDRNYQASRSSDFEQNLYGIRKVYISSCHLYNYEIYAHELGHNLGLYHTFLEDPQAGQYKFCITQSKTCNFMDYFNFRRYFWNFQGKIMRPKVR